MIAHDIRRLWRHISLKRRRQLIFLLMLMILTAFAEVLSIGAVLPFLGALVDPGSIYNNPLIKPFLDFLQIRSSNELILPLAIVFGVSAILAGMMRLLLLKASNRLIFAIGSELSISIYRRTLYQPFLVHISRNSSEVISGNLSKITNVIYGIIMPLITMVSSLIILLVFALILLVVNPLVLVTVAGVFGVIYAVVIVKARRHVFAAGHLIAFQSTRVLKVMQEGLGSIRDVLIDGTQETYSQIYYHADLSLRKAQEANQYIAQSPRYVIEALAMILIAVAAYFFTTDPDNKMAAIPVLGAFALGVQRLLPLLQHSYAALSSIQGGYASLHDTLILLDQPLPDSVGCKEVEPIKFKDKFALRNVSFQYSIDSPLILRGVTLEIPRGARVGFIGTTGSGKSSLLDIVMGLLAPTNGEVTIDGIPITQHNVRGWQSQIAHVPQAIFLSDASVAENIAFGVPSDLIDFERVYMAAKAAQIADTIERWSEKYLTRVGERGVRLSGGQRQRIGIARALYKQSDVIVFDEATSALDSETESAVMKAIDCLGANQLTIFMVAHRLSTLKNCSLIVELKNGKINRVGSYKEIVGDGNKS